MLDAQLERRRITSKAIMASTSKTIKKPVATRYGGGLGKPIIDQAHAEHNRFDEDDYDESS